MKNVIEILEKQYQSFTDQERDWNFFMGLADYVKFTKEASEIRPLLNKIRVSKLKEIEIIDKLEKEAVKELTVVKKDILKMIKDEKITKQGLPEALAKLNDYEKGNINPGHYKSVRLNNGLKNLIRVLSESEEDFNKNYPKYGLSPKYIKRMNKSYELYEKSKTELWGALEKLQLVFRVIFRKNEYLNNIKNDEEEIKRFKELIEEIEIIKDDGGRAYIFSPRNSKFSSSTDVRIKEFKKDNYKLYATRIHNYLIQELNLEQGVKTDKFNEEVFKTKQLLDKLESDINKKIKAKAKYNNGILYFRDKEINFRNKPNQKDLLATIFEEPKRNWSYDEIQDKWDEMMKSGLVNKPKDYWKKFYSAGDDINKTVAIETQIKDFIIKNTKEIKINPKYI